MVEEKGIVTQVSGDTAKVLVKKKSACDGCTTQGACKSTSDGMEIDAFNPVHAEIGQHVKVTMTPHSYLKGSILVYGIPMIVFIGGAILGKNMGESYVTGFNSDLIAALTGFAALILSLTALKVWSKGLENKKEYKPVIEKIYIEDSTVNPEL